MLHHSPRGMCNCLNNPVVKEKSKKQSKEEIKVV